MRKLAFLLFMVSTCLLLAGCPVIIPIPIEGPEGEGEVLAEGEVVIEGEVEGEPEGEVKEEGEVEPVDPYLLALEQEVYVQINARRTAAGVPELFLDSRVRAVARAHSQDMADNDYFAHNALDGESPGERLDAANIHWMQYGENLAYNYAYDDPATVAVEGWIDSSGHRRNLLDPDYTHTGVGIAVDTKGAFYITQDFVRY